mgnify:FL=1
MTFGQKKEGKEQRKFFRQIVGRQKKHLQTSVKMNLFRLNPRRADRGGTGGHQSYRQRLFRPIRGEPRRFVVVRGQVSPPASTFSTFPNLNREQDPESLSKGSGNRRERRVRDCNLCLLGIVCLLSILVLLLLSFSIVALVTFFYREDISTIEKWEFLTG